MNNKKKWTLYIVLSAFILIVGVVGWKVYGTYAQLDSIQKSEDESRFGHFEKEPENAPPEWEGTERVNILLLGADERGMKNGEVARSDAMIVVSIDPVTKGIHLLSVLRDTYVDIPGYAKNRINAAITLGGPELAMKTVGNLLDLDIQYYFYADFQGFIALVDAIGGVDFYVEKDMYYTDKADNHEFDIDLKQGQQLLDGDKALQYVRFRHDKLSDFTRTERQRDLLKAIASKLQSGWNLFNLPEILAKVTPHLETNMSPGDMLKLAALGLKSHSAGSAQIPPMNLIIDERVSGAAVLAIRNLDELKLFVLETLAEDTSKPETSDGAGDSGAADGGAADDGETGDNVGER